jgi:hypothetical protein
MVVFGAYNGTDTKNACLRRLESLQNFESDWPDFSGSPSDLDQLKGALSSFSFNALELSDNDLTVVLGEMFHQAI